jgi:hypothetical protein
MGGLQEGCTHSFYCELGLELYSNNRTALNYKQMIGTAYDQQLYFVPQNSLQPGITIGQGLPLSLTLLDGTIYGGLYYNNTLETHNTTNEWFNNSDLFGIKASPYDGCPETSYCNANSSDTIQWIRVRKSPPNNIFPIASTVN